MAQKIYAVGDIHGQRTELERVLALIEKDGGPEAKIVFLGDYTDRGSDSRGVLDILIEGRDTGRNWTFLKGNHDRMFEWFMGAPLLHDPYLPIELYWLHPRLGGDTTLASYGVDASGTRREKDVQADALQAVPTQHLEFLRNLEFKLIVDGLMFVHAGIRPGVPLELQTEQDLLWIRRPFHDSDLDHPNMVVHGHTPVKQATHYGNRINLDTGAGYGHPLTAAVFENELTWVLTDNGRVPIHTTVR